MTWPISLNRMRKRLITKEALKMFKYFEVSKTFAKFELLKILIV